MVMPFNFDETSEGERVQVICSVKRGDLPLTLNWLKDGARITQHDPPTGLKVLPLDQYSSTLLLANAHAATHSGNYTCMASNPARTASHSATLVIKGTLHECMKVYGNRAPGFTYSGI
ncbi:hypothetical protein Pcinc_038271 [Petrolisthes cinctipes]|uniref:Ig-like domain-containing protein n=1 Tax=Petrolisthes cinctipes TaxID=88211 RepID=A0AAE1BR07_PETCI|nr:hypothetical protein Pcinc_038271 [Petrolisthes cinctipes]